MPSGTIFDKLLALLEQYGWEEGILRLRASLAVGRSEDEMAGRLFAAWHAAQRGDFSTAETELKLLAEQAGFAGWAQLGQAHLQLRQRQLKPAFTLLEQASGLAADKPILRGSICLVQGTTLFHMGNSLDSLPLLEEAAELLDANHFLRGRVLDAMGMWYSSDGNVQAAIEFYEAALTHKQRVRDIAGEALTQGQLGRLHLDWGHWEAAERHFRNDLEICGRIEDRRGEAQMYCSLGRVAMLQGHCSDAADYLSEAIARSHAGGWKVLEGFAYKDQALCSLNGGDAQQAAEHLAAAEQLFAAVDFGEGLAHVQRARGIILRQQRDWSAAVHMLREALHFFQSTGEIAEAARAQLDIALTHQEQVAAKPLVRDEAIKAVKAAERSRRSFLVKAADDLLHTVDPKAGAQHIYQRVRGRSIKDDATDLTSATRASVTVMFFDLQNFTRWANENDPNVVMLSLNQMMAAFADTVTKHQVQVIEYMGDGFLALAVGADHARRTVRLALELEGALERFNRPRRILQLPEFKCRIGISTGEVVLGNVGTYDKIDYRAVGSTVNLAARVQGEAIPGRPCISRATHSAVKNHFAFVTPQPRLVDLKGLGEVDVWDVIAQK